MFGVNQRMRNGPHEMVVVVFHDCIVCEQGTVGVLFASGIVTVGLLVDEKLAKTPQLAGRLKLCLCMKWLSVRGSLAPNVAE